MPLDGTALEPFHDARLRELLTITDLAAQGEAATQYINWLDACRQDATAIRDVVVHKLNKDHGLGALRVASALGLQKSRGQQLIHRASESYPAAAQVVAKLRRRLARS